MARAEEPAPPADARLRTAIDRSLGFLEKETDEWMNTKDCNGCHHVPEMLWTYHEAGRRGVKVDQAKVDELIDWSDAREKKTKVGTEMTALLRLAMPERPVPEVTQVILAGQRADGSWKPAGQFEGMQARGKAEASANATRLLLLALATQPGEQPALDAARAKAAPVFDRHDPAKTVDSLVVRLLYTRRFGPPEEIAERRADILKQQQADGGWAYQIGETQSDSLATGEALYALQQEPDAASAEPIARGQNWLFDWQREDGGWAIDVTHISRLDHTSPAKSKSLKDSTGIYTFYGSAWATIGLLQGLPVVETAEKKE